MKMNHLILSIVLLLVNHLVQAQNVLDREVDIQAKSMAVDSLFRKIQNQTGVIFSYEKKIIPANATIQLNPGRYTVRELLQVIDAKLSTEHDIIDNHIILTRKKSVGIKRKFTVNGVISNTADDEKLIGVSVYVNASTGTV